MGFKAFDKIERIGKLKMDITQKIHGSNAAVWIKDDEIGCQSRNRIITPEADNYGFATFVYANKDEFIIKLGPGLHFGEWAGPGINSGEGLKEKTFVLFDHWKFPAKRPLPPQCMVVPVLYQGRVDFSQIELAMNILKTEGSKLVPGFMRPEGIVTNLGGTRYKLVFDAEETAWKNTEKPKSNLSTVDVGYLLQPVRLEKLLSGDSKYLENYPASMPVIVKDYIADLIAENQIDENASEVALTVKHLKKNMFVFIKSQLKEKGLI